MKIGFVFSAVLSLFAIQSFAANGTMKGDGSAEKPFQIEDYFKKRNVQCGWLQWFYLYR